MFAGVDVMLPVSVCLASAMEDHTTAINITVLATPNPSTLHHQSTWELYDPHGHSVLNVLVPGCGD